MVPELFYKNIPESLCIRKLGNYTTHGYLMCNKFCAL